MPRANKNTIFPGCQPSLFLDEGQPRNRLSVLHPLEIPRHKKRLWFSSPRARPAALRNPVRIKTDQSQFENKTSTDDSGMKRVAVLIQRDSVSRVDLCPKLVPRFLFPNASEFRQPSALFGV